jgi:hypothetical protein
MRYGDGDGGFWELNSFPGCNQIVVSGHAFIPESQRGQGRGDANHKKRLAQMRGFGYDYAMCTVKDGNVAQKAILAKNGWKELDWFYNNETGHGVTIYGRRIHRAD